MDKPRTTPKDFFLWAGAMVALYGAVIAFISLVFDYINFAFPDTLQYYGNPYDSISYEMAALIVLAPVFLLLMRVIRRDIMRDRSRADIWVRRWALFLTVFLAGAAMVIDLITLITTFLSGDDITLRFALKVLIVLLVVAAGFMHFLADIWGYWAKFPERARYVNWATALVVLVAVVAGFFIVGTPAEARRARFDEQRVSDLQSIQSQIVYYWQQKGSLPAALSDLNDPISYFSVPTDPATGASYEYTRQSPLDFTLCATFATQSRPMPRASGADSWDHGPGRVCFDRSIDPQLHAPVGTKTPTPAPVR